MYTLKRTISSLGDLVKERTDNKFKVKQKELVEKIISVKTPYSTLAAEADYEILLEQSNDLDKYGYDPISNWLRGIDRARQLSQVIPTFTEAKRVLEVACGDAMSLVILKAYGMDVHGIDLVDWRDNRAQDLSFSTVNIEEGRNSLPGAFDFIYSYNAFEHFSDPKKALHTIVNLVRPGGYLFFEFGPLYMGPWGLHAYRMLPMAFPQFLFSEVFLKDKLRETGVRDLGRELAELQPLNRWSVRQFDELWKISECDIILNHRTRATNCLDLVVKYPESFQGRDLTYKDLTTQSMRVLLRKPS